MSASLQEILELEQIEVSMFRGRTRPTDMPRVFGSEVAGQALVAAGRTVPADRHVHSLHAYFLRPGDPTHPILYAVDAIRDGRSFTTRRVVAVQHGEPIFNLSVLRSADLRTQAWFATLKGRFPIEVRFAEELPRLATVTGRSGRSVSGFGSGRALNSTRILWFTYAPPPTPLICFLLAAARPPHGVVIDDEGVQLASLDHALWFHAPFRIDEWLFYDQEASGPAGLVPCAAARCSTGTARSWRALSRKGSSVWAKLPRVADTGSGR